MAPQLVTIITNIFARFSEFHRKFKEQKDLGFCLYKFQRQTDELGYGSSYLRFFPIFPNLNKSLSACLAPLHAHFFLQNCEFLCHYCEMTCRLDLHHRMAHAFFTLVKQFEWFFFLLYPPILYFEECTCIALDRIILLIFKPSHYQEIHDTYQFPYNVRHPNNVNTCSIINHEITQTHDVLGDNTWNTEITNTYDAQKHKTNTFHTTNVAPMPYNRVVLGTAYHLSLDGHFIFFVW